MRRRALLAAGIAVAMLAAFWFLAWAPVSHQLTHARTHLSEAQAEQAQLRSELVQLKSEESQKGSYQAALAALDQAVPGSASVAPIFDQLNAAATGAGVTLTSVSPSTSSTASSPAATAGGLTPLPISMSVTGQYPQIIRFIEAVDSSPRLFVINGLQMGGGSQGGAGASSLTAQIQTVAYYKGTTAP